MVVMLVMGGEWGRGGVGGRLHWSGEVKDSPSPTHLKKVQAE